MLEIGYQKWGLIPAATDPATEGSLVSNPPMLTTVAMDRDTCLAFQFAESTAKLLIKLETTTMSGEGRGTSLFQVFSGSSSDLLHELQHEGWEKSIEGMYTIFSAQVRNAEQYIKLLYTEKDLLVVNQIAFFREE